MGKFDELIQSVGVGDDGISLAYPDSFMDDIGAAYAEDMSIPVAKIQVLEQDLAVALAEIDRLKAHNYDLLMTAPAVEAEEENSEEENSEDDEEGTDSLFGNDDKEED